MTTKYDPALCERLIAEAREDHATIAWADDHFRRPDTAWPECGHDEETCPCFTNNDKVRAALAAATLRTRNNLRALADQLSAARLEIARLRVIAIEAILAAKPILSTERYEQLRADAYRAARDGEGEHG